jgi:hypothetical protein
VRNCLKKKSDEKEKVNQACEDHEQVFVAALLVPMIIPRTIGLSIPVQRNT